MNEIAQLFLAAGCAVSMIVLTCGFVASGLRNRRNPRD